MDRDSVDIISNKVKAAFFHPFVDPDSKNTRRLLRHIERCWDKFAAAACFAPYLTLFQSSGMGKTRLVAEAAKSVLTFYWCLRMEGSTGYPPRTAMIAPLLSKEALTSALDPSGM